LIRVFLPAYNEAIALPRLVRKFDEEMRRAKESYRILVLDDGSRDDTAKIARELARDYPVDLLVHERNQGLGATMRDGLDVLAKESADGDLIVTLDCDDTHEPKFLPAALAKVRDGYDVVILSRYAPGGGQTGLSATKTFLSAGAGAFLKLFFPIRGVKEYSCNYRVYRAAILKKALSRFGKDFIRLAHLGFVVTPEVLVRMRMLGARIGESPFILRYEQKPTPSANQAFRTIRGYFALVATYWLRKP